MQKLEKLNPESRVVVDGYETGLDEVSEIFTLNIAKNTFNNSWDGEFDVSYSETNETAVYLPRSS